jgi:triacylglycerol esterase/lipase EstA (alpha/beta hydrolase family)
LDPPNAQRDPGKIGSASPPRKRLPHNYLVHARINLFYLAGWLLCAAGPEASGWPCPRASTGGAWVPVLLVPGWGDDAVEMEPLRRRFIEAGWPERHVSVLSFGDPVGSNEAHAREIESAVTLLSGVAEADAVDLVAHSMGGLATRYFLLESEGASRCEARSSWARRTGAPSWRPFPGERAGGRWCRGAPFSSD